MSCVQGVNAAPDVAYQLAHFSHSFITNLRSDAHDLTAGNEGVTPEHIQLAYDLRSFTKSRIQRQYAKFEEATMPEKPADRKRRGGDLEETEQGPAKRGAAKKKSAKRIQFDIDALEAEIMAELEGPAESVEMATEPIPDRTKERDDDNASPKEQDKEVPSSTTANTKSSEEDEGHTTSNGTKLRGAHKQRLAPETRTVVSMEGNN